jgi:peptidoglycan/LPS O-acetylase OafA/YrhL
LAKLDSCLHRLAAFYEIGRNSGRSAAMEGIRGIAVLLVFAVHAHAIFSPLLERESFARAVSAFLAINGHSGVDMFFVLSGYLIYGLALKNSHGVGGFWKRRLRRVYPAFLVIFAVVAAAKAALGMLDADAAGMNLRLYLLLNAALVPGIVAIEPVVTVAWTLSYEMLFYMAVPAAAVLLKLNRWRWRARLMLCLSAGAAYMIWRLADPLAYWPALRIAPTAHPRLLLFLVGIAIYEVMSWRALRERLNAWTEAFSVALWMASFAAVHEIQKREATLLVANWRTVALCAGLPGLFLHALANPGMLERAMSWTPLRWLGNMSYSFYLSHGLAMNAIGHAGRKLDLSSIPGWLSYCLLAAASFVFAWLLSSLLFGLVEKPLSLSRSQEPVSKNSVEAARLT